MAGGIIAFTVLAVAAHQVPYFHLDVTLTRDIQRVHARWFVLTLRALSAIGFPPLVDFIAAGIVAALALAGRRWHAIGATIAAVGIAALNFIVKALVNRPRPSPDLVHVEHAIRSTSFPAGHVMTFAAFFGFLAWLAWTRLAPSWRRFAIVAALVSAIGLIGVSRIAAGEHWPSDVLGGYLLGALWLAVTVRIHAWGLARSRPRRLRARTGSSAPA